MGYFQIVKRLILVTVSLSIIVMYNNCSKANFEFAGDFHQPYSTAEMNSKLTEDNSSAEQFVSGRLLVLPRPGLSEDEFEKILKQHGAKQVGQIDQINVRVLEVQVGSEKAVEALLKHNKHLKFAERDMLLRPEMTANDSLFTSEWHLSRIGTPIAWESSQGENVIIAILDSGVDGTHPDLSSKMVQGWNFWDNNADASDVYGHGTKVAGSAAAITNNSIGIASVAPGARIMPIRVTDTSGMGSVGLMASGITWAADHGAKVANLSFSKAGGYSTIQTAGQYMKNKGGLVVTASGNDYIEVTFTPSNSTIVVGATDTSDLRANWSNYGQFLDIMAPGTSIWTTARGGTYSSVAGTSFATPITGGVIALMMAANPALGPADLERILFSTAVDLGTPGFDIYFGNGRVDAAAAVQAALTATPSDITPPVVAIINPISASKVNGIIAVDVTASDNIEVAKVELRLNGVLVASDSLSPYGFSVDTTKVADGSATLQATAFDAAGNSSSTSITLTVANSTSVDIIAPVPRITNPLAGSTVKGNVSISGSATDNVGVVSLRLFIDGVQVASVSGASLSYTWNSRKASSGAHTLMLRATDAAGNSAVTSIVVSK